jgi:hypothetical protein
MSISKCLSIADLMLVALAPPFKSDFVLLEGLHHLQVVQVHRGGADAGIDHDGEWCQQQEATSAVTPNCLLRLIPTALS